MATKLRSLPPQVEDLKRHGIASVIPLFDGKKPGYADWQRATDEEIRGRFWSWSGDSPLNFGIRLGRDFGSLVDIDLDSAESRALVKYFFPTSLKFGRGGNTTHVLFKQVGRELMDSKRFLWDKRDEKSVLLEVRFNGQTMGPGSTHPDSGEQIVWTSEPGVGLAEITGEELKVRSGKLAAAALLLRDWAAGWRDEVCVCLCGAMLRAGWTVDEADGFFAAIADEAGDEEAGSREKAARLERLLTSGGRVPGLRKLLELVGDSMGGRLLEWLELRGGSLLEEMNERHALIMVGGSAYILDEIHGNSNLLKKEAFNMLWANRRVQHRGREVGASDFWMQSEGRRSYSRGLAFLPEWRGLAEGSEEWKQAGYGDVWNLWKGFGVQAEPGRGGMVDIGGVRVEVEWASWARHVYEELCWEDDGIWRWVLGWLAHRVARPWEIPGSAIVMIGERGDGKGTIASIYGRLFGEGFMSVTHQNQLVGKFNSHLENKVLVYADEATWGGDKVGEGMLKTMITDERRVIERKGQEAYTVDNCCAYMIASNHEWVVPVGRMERRFFISKMRGGHAGDIDYFDGIRRSMLEEGGLEVMLRGLSRLWECRDEWECSFVVGGPAAGMGLSNVRWSGDNGGGGDIAWEQWLRSAGSIEQWLVEVLVEREELGERGGVWWWATGGAIVMSGAFSAYENWCGRRGIRHMESTIHFGKVLCKLLPIQSGASGRCWVRTANGERELGRKIKDGWSGSLFGFLREKVGFGNGGI